MTLKEIQQLKKPYPYKEVAEKLNNLQSIEEYSTIDKIIAEGEIQSVNMVGIKKLYRMITNIEVKNRMRIKYNL